MVTSGRLTILYQRMKLMGLVSWIVGVNLPTQLAHFGFFELPLWLRIERTFVTSDYWIVKHMSFHPFNHKGPIVA
jgi:hypothetical protein